MDKQDNKLALEHLSASSDLDTHLNNLISNISDDDTDSIIYTQQVFRHEEKEVNCHINILAAENKNNIRPFVELAENKYFQHLDSNKDDSKISRMWNVKVHHQSVTEGSNTGRISTFTELAKDNAYQVISSNHDRIAADTTDNTAKAHEICEMRNMKRKHSNTCIDLDLNTGFYPSSSWPEDSIKLRSLKHKSYSKLVKSYRCNFEADISPSNQHKTHSQEILIEDMESVPVLSCNNRKYATNVTSEALDFEMNRNITRNIAHIVCADSRSQESLFDESETMHHLYDDLVSIENDPQIITSSKTVTFSSDLNDTTISQMHVFSLCLKENMSSEDRPIFFKPDMPLVNKQAASLVSKLLLPEMASQAEQQHDVSITQVPHNSLKISVHPQQKTPLKTDEGKHGELLLTDEGKQDKFSLAKHIVQKEGRQEELHVTEHARQDEALIQKYAKQDEPPITEHARQDDPQIAEHARQDVPPIKEYARYDEPPIKEHARYDEPPITEHARQDEPPIKEHARYDEPPIKEHARYDEPPIKEYVRQDEPRIIEHVRQGEPPNTEHARQDELPLIEHPRQDELHLTEYVRQDELHLKEEGRHDDELPLIKDTRQCEIVTRQVVPTLIEKATQVEVSIKEESVQTELSLIEESQIELLLTEKTKQIEPPRDKLTSQIEGEEVRQSKLFPVKETKQLELYLTEKDRLAEQLLTEEPRHTELSITTGSEQTDLHLKEKARQIKLAPPTKSEQMNFICSMLCGRQEIMSSLAGNRHMLSLPNALHQQQVVTPRKDQALACNNFSQTSCSKTLSNPNKNTHDASQHLLKLLSYSASGVSQYPETAEKIISVRENKTFVGSTWMIEHKQHASCDKLSSSLEICESGRELNTLARSTSLEQVISACNKDVPRFSGHQNKKHTLDSLRKYDWEHEEMPRSSPGLMNMDGIPYLLSNSDHIVAQYGTNVAMEILSTNSAESCAKITDCVNICSEDSKQIIPPCTQELHSVVSITVHNNDTCLSWSKTAPSCTSHFEDNSGVCQSISLDVYERQDTDATADAGSCVHVGKLSMCTAGNQECVDHNNETSSFSLEDTLMHEEQKVPEVEPCPDLSLSEVSMYSNLPKDTHDDSQCISQHKQVLQWDSVYKTVMNKSVTDQSADSMLEGLCAIVPTVASHRSLRIGLSKRQKVTHLHKKL